MLGFNFLGLGLHTWLHVPLPGNVLGMILFTACLFLRIIKLEWVESSAQFLLQHLALFFVPLIVGTMVLLPVIGRNALAIAVGIIGSTLVTMVITGWVTEACSGNRAPSKAKPSEYAEGGSQIEY